MRPGMSKWLHDQAQEEQKEHGGEYIFITVEKDSKEGNCSVQCSEETALTVIDHLVNSVSAEGMMKLLMSTLKNKEAEV